MSHEASRRGIRECKAYENARLPNHNTREEEAGATAEIRAKEKISHHSKLANE